MNRFPSWISFVVTAVLVSVSFGQEAGKTSGDKPPARPDAAAVAKWIEQLKSSEFKTRDQAVRELSKLEDVPDALRESVKSADLETKRRAEAVVAVITARIEEREFKALVADLHKVEVDRFIRRMTTDDKFAGAKEWKVIEALAKVVTKRANELGGRKYPVPDFDITSLPIADLAVDRVFLRGKRVLFNNVTQRITAVDGCVILCTGTMPRITGLSNSIIIVDGDFTGATELEKCLLIVRGKVGSFNGVTNSIVLATGEFGTKRGFLDEDELQGATVCDSSFVQVKNTKIRFTGSDNSVLIKTLPKTTGPTTSRVLDTDKGPLQMLKFSEPKIVPDDKLTWGKEVNGLAVAIAPTERQDAFLVRWKNVGKEKLEIRMVRANSDPLLQDADDLRDHVFVKGLDGKFLATKKPQFPPRKIGPARRPGSIVLEPGKSFEETLELSAYVERPAVPANYELSIELDITDSLEPRQKDAKYWTGKVQSNKLKIDFGK